MAPAEADILASYLLQPAPLTAITTFDNFRALFPRAVQADAEPRIRSLFRDLQAQREAVVGEVAQAVAAEVKRGVAMRREVARVRREADEGDVGDGEVEMERALFAEKSGAKSVKHSLNSIVLELDGATGALELEIEKLQQEEAALLESIQQTIGGLSDLRYGKFANAQLRDEVMDGLTTLQQACEDRS